MSKGGLEAYANPEPESPHSLRWVPPSSACNLLSDSPCLKDTEDGVKEVS